MRKVLYIFGICLSVYLLQGQETFAVDSIISDTVYITKSGGKFYENQTFVDKNYNSLTTKKEIKDTLAYVISKLKKIEDTVQEIQLVDDEISSFRKMIKSIGIRKDILLKQRQRHEKLIKRLRAKY